MKRIAQYILGGLILFAVTTIVVGVSIVWFGPFAQGSVASAPPAPTPPPSDVTYQIRFDKGVSNPYMGDCGRFSVTYAVPSGTSQRDVEACKGVTTVDSFAGEWGDFLYLSIQYVHPRNSLARFSCIITVNGRQVAEVESVGSPNIATCKTSLR